jgi:hypothetical protein
MTIQMILPIEHCVTVGARILYFIVYGSVMSLNVFRIAESRVADLTLVPGHLLGVVGDLVVAVYMRQQCQEIGTRRTVYLLEAGPGFTYLAAITALEARPLEYCCCGICQTLQFVLSPGSAAGDVGRRAIGERIRDSRLNRSRSRVRLFTCMVLIVSLTSCSRLCTVPNPVLCPVVISCA